MKKNLIKIAVVILVLLVAAAFVITLTLDSIVRKGVVSVGPQITKSDIKLDGVSISMLSGKGEIRGMVIGNPAGFKTASAINVGKASLKVEPKSLLSDKIIVRSVRVEAPEITFEGSLKGSNLSALLANIEAFTASEKASADKKPSKKLQVDDFVLTGAKVKLSMTLFEGKAATVPLPDIHLADLGKGENGVTPGELAEKIFKAIFEKTTSAVTGAIADLGKGVTDAAKNVGKGVSEGAEKAVKGIGDLFKKK